jgi:hypothetical protein
MISSGRPPIAPGRRAGACDPTASIGPGDGDRMPDVAAGSATIITSAAQAAR